MEFDLAIKRKGNLAICDNMNGPWGHYAKWNNSEKDKYCLISIHADEFFLGKKKNHENKLMDIENILVAGRVSEMGEDHQKGQTSSYKLVMRMSCTAWWWQLPTLCCIDIFESC